MAAPTKLRSGKAGEREHWRYARVAVLEESKTGGDAASISSRHRDRTRFAAVAGLFDAVLRYFFRASFCSHCNYRGGKHRNFGKNRRQIADDCVPGDRPYLCRRNCDRRNGRSIACEWGIAGRLAGGRTGPYDEAVGFAGVGKQLPVLSCKD